MRIRYLLIAGAAALALGLAGCGSSDDDSTAEAPVTMPEPMPDPDPVPTDLEATQTAAAAAATAAGDRVGPMPRRRPDGAEDGDGMTLATLQTGDDSNSDAMGGREAAYAAHAAAGEAAAEASEGRGCFRGSGGGDHRQMRRKTAWRDAVGMPRDAAVAAEATAMAQCPRRRSQPR